MIKIVGQVGVVANEVKLTSFVGGTKEMDGFTVKAPISPGAYPWRAMPPEQRDGEARHQENSTASPFKVEPHAISMAVWGEPFPVVVNARFKIKVGVKCHAECKLTGGEIKVYNGKGKKVGAGRLGGAPWVGTSSLYWAEVGLKAPRSAGYYEWKLRFAKGDLEVPHEEASYSFAFRTARAPEHVVTVKVVDGNTNKPIEDAYVFLKMYRASTDESGVANVEVPKGTYELNVSKDGYQALQKTVEVTANVTVKAELLPLPPSQRW